MIKCISAGIQAELVTFAAGTVNVRKLMDGRWVEELCCSKTSTWRDFWLSQIDINMVKCTWLQRGSLILGSSPNHHVYKWFASLKIKQEMIKYKINVNCRNTNGKSTGGNQGRSQVFSTGTHIFFQIPPPPSSIPNLTGRSTHIDVISSPLYTAKTGLGENDVFTFYTIVLAIWAHL